MRRADVPRLSRFLGRAFVDDPVMRYVLPERGSRERKVAWLQGRGVAHGRLYGTAETTDELDGVAVWFGPDQERMSAFCVLRSGLIWAPWKLGPVALVRLRCYYTAKKRLRQRCCHPDHWYLFLVAVDPERQGGGSDTVSSREVSGGPTGSVSPVTSRRARTKASLTSNASASRYEVRPA